MIAVDSSVVVAGFASWHEHHPAAVTALDDEPQLPWHVSLEVYSVLTRLPGGLRVDGALVIEFLADRFRHPPLTLPAPRARQLPAAFVELDVHGGAVYDALIALTATAHDAELVTLDERAASTYARCGARYRVLH